MLVSQRKPVTSARYEPVAYDVSIVARRGFFDVDIREDAEIMTIRRHSLIEAQSTANCLPDYGSWVGVPWSVFYPGGA